MFQGRLLPESMRTADGGRVERRTDIRFSFDGADYLGCGGDTLASALLANGVHLVGRSMKYHRPRGIVAAGAEEPNALVAVVRGGGRTTPNLRATQVELFEGLEAHSQNRWPSLNTDLGALVALAAPLLPAGFYYKTMMGPRGLGLWHRVFEPLVRRAAGLGRAPRVADPDRYARYYAHCDVLVAGAGPAGIAAALAAGRGGARTILCDEQAEPGGALLSEIAALIDGIPAREWLAQSLAELAAMPHVRVMPRTTAFGCYPHNMVGLAERVTDHLAAPSPDQPRERLWRVRARRIVLATGAIERPLVFPGNDRPGVMLAGAAREYLLRWGVKVGSRVVIATACDTAYRAALDLATAGVAVKLVVDLRAAADGPLPQAARAAGIAVLAGGRVLGTHLRGKRLDSVLLGRGDDGRRRWFDCDALLMCNGWTPAVHLHAQARGALRWEGERGVFLPGEPAPGVESIGACNGATDLAMALAQGAASGGGAVPVVEGEVPALPGPAHVDAAVAGDAFVDFQNDVRADDVRQAVAEGFHAIEHVKRYTAGGLGTDQGKTGNMNLLALAAAARGTPIPELGTTTFRPPYTPVSFGTLAGPARGEMFDPVRTTPLHAQAVAEGAVFEDVGQWKRARYFPQAGEDMHAAVRREVATTRAAAGLFDASTLGKIEVVGPDAAIFLDRLYLNAIATLKPGRCRYGVMLSEAGFVMDDGVMARLAPDRFHVTTTTSGAAHVLAHMEDYRQTEWPELRVWLTSTTEHWAVLAVQGPRARDVLAPLVAGDISAAALPHMAVRDLKVAGIPARMMRVSFSGEQGFEVNAPARHAPALWDALRPRIAAAGGTVYGTEAMHVLRAEKGYIIVGQETDGTVTPGDLGMAIGRGKGDFIGRRSLARPDMLAADRRQLVGLLSDDPALVLEEGAQIVAQSAPPPGTKALGHVTSSYFSPALGRSIALALLAGGRERTGERLFVPLARGSIGVAVAAPVFLDPQGGRLHV
ncbi:MAG: sarcosine oxidase subunit alpha family protein [Acetobacteraceae bacterium]|nr:sarcosine oxidase subunit alpha family protein [Acetobacteraceae bacterium]